MRRWTRELALAGVVVVLQLAAVQRWRGATLDSQVPVTIIAAPIRARDAVDPDSLDTAANLVTRSDPFRFSRSTSRPTATGPQESPVHPSRLQLVLKAIVGGPTWHAVIDGLPGQPPGAVVEIGSDFDGLRVLAITPDSVVVRHGDTTWTLTMRAGVR